MSEDKKQQEQGKHAKPDDPAWPSDDTGKALDDWLEASRKAEGRDE